MLRSRSNFVVAVAVCSFLCAGAAVSQPVLPDIAKDWTYVSNSQCKVCHNKAEEGGQWDAWKASTHAKAFETLKSEKAVQIAKDLGLAKAPHEAPECLKCHVTGYDAAAAAPPAKIKPEDGIQCETCHGPASLHAKDGQKLKFKPAEVESIDIMAHHIKPDENLCKGCHNADSPTWNAEKYTLEDGSKVGFDFKQAHEKMKHDFPEGVLEAKYSGKYPTD